MVWRTSLWAMVISTLSAVPGACLLGGVSSQWRRVMLDWHCRNDAERVLLLSALGAVLGSWLGAVPVPLDWDRKWQAWPLTCVYGGLGGYLLGLASAALGACRITHAPGKAQ